MKGSVKVSKNYVIVDENKNVAAYILNDQLVIAENYKLEEVESNDKIKEIEKLKED